MKSNRQNKILEIIEKYDLETQEELLDKLQSAGYKVTQATISRDIREMKLTKVSLSDGRHKYVSLKQVHDENLNDKYYRVLKEGYVSMDQAMNILVIKTVSGMAMAVAAALDHMKWDEIVGCIAGDDTVMCAVRSVEQTKQLMEKIERVLHQI